MFNLNNSKHPQAIIFVTKKKSGFELFFKKLLKERRKVDEHYQALLISFSAGCIKVAGDWKRSVFFIEFEQSSFNSVF